MDSYAQGIGKFSEFSYSVYRELQLPYSELRDDLFANVHYTDAGCKADIVIGGNGGHSDPEWLILCQGGDGMAKADNVRRALARMWLLKTAFSLDGSPADSEANILLVTSKWPKAHSMCHVMLTHAYDNHLFDCCIFKHLIRGWYDSVVMDDADRRSWVILAKGKKSWR